MTLLANFDDHTTIAEFGTSNMGDEFLVDGQIKNKARIIGLLRAITDLIMLIDNTWFSINKTNQEEFLQFREVLVKFKPLVRQCEKIIFNQRDKTQNMTLKEEPFITILSYIQDIQRVMLKHLDDANLIFSSSGYMDPDEYMRQLDEEATQTG